MRREGHSRALATAPPQPRDNRLFAALPREDAARLLPHLTPVTWTLGTVLYAPHHAPAYLYFPTTALVSLVYTMADGLTVDMGVVGHEGVVGLALFMGGTTMPHQALVRVAGDAFRLPATALHAEFQRGGTFQRALLRSTQALLTQIAQTAVCNGLHPIAQRLCRWLLCIHDRVPSNEIRLTHEVLAQMSAVRRETVTVMARRLRAAGLIYCGAGHITIADRRGLEARVCECYQVVQDECTRLLE